MTNKDLLDEYIKKSGMKFKFIAEKLGITVQSLNQKRNKHDISDKSKRIYKRFVQWKTRQKSILRK